MKLTRTEMFVQLTIVVLTVWFLLHAHAYHPEHIGTMDDFGRDFGGYYATDHGGYLGLAAGTNELHAYKPFVGWIFKPFLFLKPMQACYLWMGLLTASYMILAHFVMRRKYGWVLALAFLKVFWFSLSSGNITPVLCVTLLFLESSWLAVLVKPHYAFIAYCVAFVKRRELYDDRPAPKTPMGSTVAHSAPVLPIRKEGMN